MQPQRIRTISEFHRLMGLSHPGHPLISVINFDHMQLVADHFLVLDFYSIALKRNLNSKIKYGQVQYDFDEGIMFFIAPGQVYKIEVEPKAICRHSGWLLLVHPDFLGHTSLAKAVKQFEFFDYSVHEALFLSHQEEEKIINIIQNIQQEYNNNIDNFSQDIIIAQVNVLLTYADRFYNRQFITRKIPNHKILNRLENLLAEYFNNEALISKGLPSVQQVAESLNVSPNYLSGLLKVLTGQSTQQHIHDKLIEKAKEKLATTDLSVSEIAYELGFEHPQSFSKLFKAKTNHSPLEFRQSFN